MYICIRYDFTGKRDAGEKSLPFITNVAEVQRSLPFITIGVLTQNTGDAPLLVYVTCIHLDYREEPIRLKEIQSIKNKLDTILPGNDAMDNLQIWTGDFNALTKEDYTVDEWENIAAIRRENNWESPQIELTKKASILLNVFRG